MYSVQNANIIQATKKSQKKHTKKTQKRANTNVPIERTETEIIRFSMSTWHNLGPTPRQPSRSPTPRPPRRSRSRIRSRSPHSRTRSRSHRPRSHYQPEIIHELTRENLPAMPLTRERYEQLCLTIFSSVFHTRDIFNVVIHHLLQLNIITPLDPVLVDDASSATTTTTDFHRYNVINQITRLYLSCFEIPTYQPMPLATPYHLAPTPALPTTPPPSVFERLSTTTGRPFNAPPTPHFLDNDPSAITSFLEWNTPITLNNRSYRGFCLSWHRHGNCSNNPCRRSHSCPLCHGSHRIHACQEGGDVGRVADPEQRP